MIRFTLASLGFAAWLFTMAFLATSLPFDCNIASDPVACQINEALK